MQHHADASVSTSGHNAIIYKPQCRLSSYARLPRSRRWGIAGLSMDSSERWRKASKSGNGGCVEAAFSPDGHAAGKIRDSTSSERGHLVVNRDAFAAFLAAVKAR
jgi:hypothetical protein